MNSPRTLNFSPDCGLLMVDVENIIGARAKPSTVTARMDALTQLTGPNVSIVAACQGKQITQEAVRILKGYGAKVMLVKNGKDAADHALIAEAHRATGCDRFVVASADATFAQLADHGRLDVVIRQDQKINKRLTRRATSVHRLRASTSPVTPAASPRAVQPLTAPGAMAAPQPAPSLPTTSPPVTPPSQLDTAATISFRNSTTGLAGTAAAALTAGACFGFGLTIGSAAARRLLRR